MALAQWSPRMIESVRGDRCMSGAVDDPENATHYISEALQARYAQEKYLLCFPLR